MQAMLSKNLTISVIASVVATIQTGFGEHQTATAPLGAGPPRFQVEHKSPVWCLAWSPDSKLVATGTMDGMIQLLDATTGKEVRSFPTDKATIAMVFAADSKTLLTCAGGMAGRTLGIWDVETGKRPDSFTGTRNDWPNFRIFSLNDIKTFKGLGHGALHVWKLDRASATPEDSKLAGLAAMAPDASVTGWCNAQGFCTVFAIIKNAPKTTSLQVGNAQCIAFGPQAKLMAVGSEDKEVHLWDLAAQKVTTSLTGLEKPPAKLAFSADGKTLAALADDGTSVTVWDLTRNIVRCQINHTRAPACSLSLSPDGKMLATTTKDSKILFLWKAVARNLSHNGPPLELSAKELAALWTDLADADYEKADFAWRRLGAAGDNAIPVLRQQIRAVAMPPVDMKRIKKLVTALDSEKYTIRDQAGKDLLAIGELAIVPLQRLLEKPPSAEAKERARLLLKKIGVPTLTPERQRALDAIDLLEQVRTTAAIGLLEEIERDALIPQIRTEAHQALQRIKR
jgi:Anaphase-promoting complex subunit 4 WD40 domain/WD domain, G-beta repeat